MANQRWHWGSTRDYAKAHGISERTARRRIAYAAGAQKTGRGWRVPLTNAEYSKARGVSERTARRRGFLASSPTDLELLSHLEPNEMSKRGLASTRYAPRNIYVPSLRPYQYQGWAIVRFISSGDIVIAYTRTIMSSVPLSYKRLDHLIREDIKQQFGKSPIDILSTGLVHRNSVRGVA